MIAEYHLTLHEAVFRFPVAAALALWPCLATRKGGGEDAPDWVDRCRMRARLRVRRHLEANYNIIPAAEPQPQPEP